MAADSLLTEVEEEELVSAAEVIARDTPEAKSKAVRFVQHARKAGGALTQIIVEQGVKIAANDALRALLEQLAL